MFVCAGIWWLVALSPTGLIPWFSKTEGNTYATLLHHPFLSKGKPMHAQEVARRISGTVAGEVFAQVKTYQVPITNSSPSHLHYLPFASRFPLPHFTFAFSAPSSRMYFCLCFHVPSICLHLCLLKIYCYGSTYSVLLGSFSILMRSC